jgi:hypothetical protein
MVAAIHKIMYVWYNLVTGVVLFGGGMDRNHHGAKFSIPMSVLHQSSWKCYVYLGFTPLLPEHCHFHAR